MTVKSETCAAAESSVDTQKTQIEGDGAAKDIHSHSDDSDSAAPEGASSDLEADDLDWENDPFPEDDLLKEALQQYEDDMIEEFFSDAEDEKPFGLSPEGRENMERLFTQWLGPEKAKEIMDREAANYREELHRWKHRRRVRLLRGLRKAGAVAAAVIVVIVLGIVNFDDSLAFKLPEAGFEAVTQDEYNELFIKDMDDDLSSIKTIYKLGSIIEGFKLVEKLEISHMVYYVYANLNESYTFTQQIASPEIWTNAEGKSGKPIETMYGMAYFFSYDTINSLIWNYQGYTFKIEGQLSQDELIQLMMSLEREDNIEEIS